MIAAVPTGVWLPWLGALILAASTARYIAAAARGQERPSRVTWGVWSVTAGIAVVSSWAAGAPAAALVVTAAAAVIPAAVVAATFVPVLRGHRVPVDPSTRGQRLIDRACLAASAIALVGWAVTDNPAAALVWITATDAVAAIPTMRKAWRGEEPYPPYVGGVVSGGLTLLVLTSWTLPAWLFPVYFVGMCATVCALITVHRAVLVRRAAAGDPIRAPLRPAPDLLGDATTEQVVPPWARSPHSTALRELIPRDLMACTDVPALRVVHLIEIGYTAGHCDGWNARGEPTVPPARRTAAVRSGRPRLAPISTGGEKWSFTSASPPPSTSP